MERLRNLDCGSERAYQWLNTQSAVRQTYCYGLNAQEGFREAVDKTVILKKSGENLLAAVDYVDFLREMENVPRIGKVGED